MISSAAKLQLSIYNRLSEAQPDWQQLKDAACGNPYQSHEWLTAWYETIGKRLGIEPVIAVARTESRPMAILPLALSSGDLTKTLTFLGHQNGNQNTGCWNPDFYASVTPRQITLLLKEIRRETGADVLKLQNIPEVWHGRPHPLLTASAVQSPSPVFTRHLPETFDTLFQETHSKSSRKNLLRKQRHLAAAGQYHAGKADGPEQTRLAFRAFLDQRSKRAREAGIPNAFSSPEAEDFLARLLGLGPTLQDASKKTMDIWFLEAGGTIRATYLCIEEGGTLYAYSNSVAHDDMLPNSPGLILIKEIIGYACGSREIGHLDLGLGEEKYKTAWTASLPLKDNVIAYTWKGSLQRRQDRLLLKIKAGIRNSDMLWPLVRKFRKLKSRIAG